MEWAGGPSPPLCGQLTRCFSVVAELLVVSVESACTTSYLRSTTTLSYLVRTVF